jgi:hypothetical protein
MSDTARLEELGELIKKHHPKVRVALRRTREEARQIGRWLLEAEKICKKLEVPWGRWVQANCGCDRTTAWRYQQIDANWDKVEPDAEVEKIDKILEAIASEGDRVTKGPAAKTDPDLNTPKEGPVDVASCNTTKETGKNDATEVQDCSTNQSEPGTTVMIGSERNTSVAAGSPKSPPPPAPVPSQMTKRPCFFGPFEVSTNRKHRIEEHLRTLKDEFGWDGKTLEMYLKKTVESERKAKEEKEVVAV